MNREFFKTALLNILVFLSLILTFNIWFDKELWSDDYSSFVHSFENIFPFLSEDVYIDNSVLSSEIKHAPEWIAVTDNGKRSVIYFGDGDFSAFSNEIKNIKSSVTKSGTLSEVSKEDFTNVFKSGSIAIKFNAPISLTEYFNRGNGYFDSISPVTDLILFTASEDNSSIRYIYFTDMDSDISYRMPVKYNIKNLLSLISVRTSSSSGSDSYAFELNFDKAAEGVNRILFDSFVPITTQTKSIYTAHVKPIRYNFQNSFDSVFKMFGIKKNSARSYKDTDNVLNYLENYSSLKIREDGYFVYETDDCKKGVYIGKNNVTTDVLNFANSLYHNIVNSESMLVLKDIKEKENGETVYGLVYSDGGTYLYVDGIYGAEVTVKDGYISGYKQHVLSMEKSQEAFFTGSVIEAYDKIYKLNLQKGKENLKIKKLLPVNFYDGEKTELKWYVEFSDGSADFL